MRTCRVQQHRGDAIGDGIPVLLEEAIHGVVDFARIMFHHEEVALALGLFIIGLASPVVMQLLQKSFVRRFRESAFFIQQRQDAKFL